MSKIILVVWLLTSQNGVTFQYAVRHATEAECQKQAEKMRDPRTGFGRTYPIKYAECVIEVKP